MAFWCKKGNSVAAVLTCWAFFFCLVRVGEVGGGGLVFLGPLCFIFWCGVVLCALFEFLKQICTFGRVFPCLHVDNHKQAITGGILFQFKQWFLSCFMCKFGSWTVSHSIIWFYVKVCMLSSFSRSYPGYSSGYFCYYLLVPTCILLDNGTTLLVLRLVEGWHRIF